MVADIRALAPAVSVCKSLGATAALSLGNSRLWIARWTTGLPRPNDDLRKIHHRRQLRPIAQHTAIMATELTVQSERAFQKQPHVFQNNKKQGGKTKRAGKGGRRWVKDVGLGFRTPKTAIEGNYIGE